MPQTRKLGAAAAVSGACTAGLDGGRSARQESRNMIDTPTSNPLKLARQFIMAIPHAKELGMEITRLENGHATITMPYDPRLVGDPATGVLHGGAISSLMDTASGAAVMCHPAAPVSTATLDLRIDYFRPAAPGQAITARAECHHVTRSVAFIRVIATDEDDLRPVAMGTGAFTLDRPGKRMPEQAKA